MSFSNKILYIASCMIAISFRIHFIAYNFPLTLFLTTKTTPNVPRPISKRISKSIFVHESPLISGEFSRTNIRRLSLSKVTWGYGTIMGKGSGTLIRSWSNSSSSPLSVSKNTHSDLSLNFHKGFLDLEMSL